MFAVQVAGSAFDRQILVLLDTEDGTPRQYVYISNAVATIDLDADRVLTYEDDTATLVGDHDWAGTSEPLRAQWNAGRFFERGNAVIIDQE